MSYRIKMAAEVAGGWPSCEKPTPTPPAWTPGPPRRYASAGSGMNGTRAVPEDLRVNHWLLIPAAELRERFSRSSGPGGQSVNTADSRVELSFDVEHSSALPEWARARAAERLAGRLASGVLTVAASEQRSQLANRQAARARLPACSGTPSPRRSARASPPGPAGPPTSGAWKPSAAGPRSSAPAGTTTGTRTSGETDDDTAAGPRRPMGSGHGRRPLLGPARDCGGPAEARLRRAGARPAAPGSGLGRRGQPPGLGPGLGR